MLKLTIGSNRIRHRNVPATVRKLSLHYKRLDIMSLRGF